MDRYYICGDEMRLAQEMGKVYGIAFAEAIIIVLLLKAMSKLYFKNLNEKN